MVTRPTVTSAPMQLMGLEKQVDRLQMTLESLELTPEKREAGERALIVAQKLLKMRKARQQGSKP